MSDDSNDSDKTISSDDMEEGTEILHTRKTADTKWFGDYPWLETESTGESTILFIVFLFFLFFFIFLLFVKMCAKMFVTRRISYIGNYENYGITDMAMIIY